jgi:hypothetical protein
MICPYIGFNWTSCNGEVEDVSLNKSGIFVGGRSKGKFVKNQSTCGLNFANFVTLTDVKIGKITLDEIEMFFSVLF